MTCTASTKLDNDRNLHVVIMDDGNLVYSHMFRCGTYGYRESERADVLEMLDNPEDWKEWDGNDLDLGMAEEDYDAMEDVKVRYWAVSMTFTGDIELSYYSEYDSMEEAVADYESYDLGAAWENENDRTNGRLISNDVYANLAWYKAEGDGTYFMPTDGASRVYGY